MLNLEYIPVKKKKRYISYFSLILFICLFVLLSGCKTNTKDITIVAPIYLAEIPERISQIYYKEKKNLIIPKSGLNTGAEQLLSGNTDFIISEEDLSKINNRIKSINIGSQQFNIIVNANNKISQLTQEQLNDIFEGKYQNWSELGGNNTPIQVIQRNISDPLRKSVYQYYLDLNINISPLNALLMNNNAETILAVHNISGGISYAYQNNNIKGTKAIAILKNKEQMPDPTNNIYLSWNNNNKGKEYQNIIDFITNNENLHQALKEKGIKN